MPSLTTWAPFCAVVLPMWTMLSPRSLHQHAPELSRTLRNLPRPSGNNLLEPFGTYLLNLRQHTPEPSEIFWNLPPEPTPFYTGTSGTCLRNQHQHTLELSGTFRNLPPEPAPATRSGTHRSLSGLKTPLAYAVGEKNRQLNRWDSKEKYWDSNNILQYVAGIEPKKLGWKWCCFHPKMWDVHSKKVWWQIPNWTCF